MTTTIKSKHMSFPRDLVLAGSHINKGEPYLRVEEEGSFAGIHVDRDAFLGAVRSELGVLIIDKADLPEVTVEGNSTLVGVGHGPLRISASARRSTVREMRRISLAYLALAEYLEAHPPVDEQQVEALAVLIETQKVGVTETAKDVARRLLSTGKVTVQS